MQPTAKQKILWAILFSIVTMVPVVVFGQTSTSSLAMTSNPSSSETVSETTEQTTKLKHELTTAEATTTKTTITTKPTTKPIACPPFDDTTMLHGNITYSGYTDLHHVGTVATFLCNKGYTSNGTGKRTCTTKGEWDGTTPNCTAIDCKDPSSKVENGNLEPDISDKTTFGSTATYTCNMGYTEHGNNKSYCEANGNWSQPTFSCTEKDCHPPQDIENGSVTFNQTYLYSTAQYSCDTGYELKGNEEITCTPNGTWEETPHCNIIEKSHKEECSITKQCITTNSGCFHDKEGVNRCLCSEDDYFNSTGNACIKRPEIPKEMQLAFRTDYTTTTSLSPRWKANSDLANGFSIRLIWKSSRNNETDSIDRVWDDSILDTKVPDLQPGTEYTFFLYFVRNNVTTKLVSSASNYTKPLPVSVIIFGYTGENTINITWPNTRCETYSLSLNDNFFKIDISRPDEEDNLLTYTFGNLTGGTNYKVSIVAEVPGWKSEPKSEPHYTRPKPPTRIVKSVYQNLISLNIFKSNDSKTDGFKVNVTNLSSSNDNIKIVNSAATISNLEAGTLYFVNVYSYLIDNNKNQLLSEKWITITAYTRPNPPNSLEAFNVFEHTLDLNWTLDDSSPFDYFILQFREIGTDVINSTRIEKDVSFLHITNLEAGTLYTFELFTVINGTESESSAKKSVFTKPVGPSQPETSERTNVSIIVTFPNDENKTFDEYIVNGTGYDRGNGTIEINDLSPGENFTFTVFTAVNTTTLSSHNVSFENFTCPAPPKSASFPDDKLHENSLEIQWEPVTEGNVDYYIIKLNNESRNVSHDSEGNDVTFLNLTPGTLYEANIYSYWRHVQSYEYFTNATFTSMLFQSSNSIELPEDKLYRIRLLKVLLVAIKSKGYYRPPAPNVTLTSVTMNSLSFTMHDKWDGYKFKLNGKDENIVYVQHHTINDLTAGTFYTVEIYSVINKEPHNIVGESNLTIASYTKPNPVERDSIQEAAENTSSDTLALKWTKPSGSVDKYEIKFECTSPNQNASMKPTYVNFTKETQSSVSGLDPGTFCNVSITTHVGKQRGEETQQQINWSTNEKAPEKIEQMKVETSARSLNVSWNPPLNPNGVVRTYTIDVIDVKNNCTFTRTVYTCDNCTNMSNGACEGSDQVSEIKQTCGDDLPPVEMKFNTTNKYNHIIGGLHPYRNYTVYITPYTRCFGKKDSMTIETDQAAPGGPPIDIIQNKENTTANSLSLSWKPPDEVLRNGIITNYSIAVTYKDRTCFNNQTEDKEIPQTIPATPDNVNDAIIYWTIDKLFPYWSYDVTVTAWTIAGPGNESHIHTMITKQSTPDSIISPPTKGETSKSSVVLNWDHPCLVNGIISHYKIGIIRYDRNGDSHHEGLQTTNTNETSYNVTGLLPYHNYTFSVAATNTINQTGKAVSTSEKITTDIAAPYRPANITVVAISANQLHVKWTTPKLYTGPTQYYVVATDVNDSSKLFNSTVYGFDKTKANIGGLDEYWSYTVKIISKTDAGQNESDTSKPTKTMESAPGNVTNLVVKTEQNITLPRSLDVTWGQPAVRDLNGILENYFVIYSASINGEIVKEIEVLSPENHRLPITGIQPGDYNVSVFAATSAGNGSVTSCIKNVPPGAPIIQRQQENASDPLIKKSIEPVPDDKTQIVIDLPINFLCDDDNGRRIKNGIIITADTKTSNGQFVGTKAEWDNKKYKSWKDVHENPNLGPYITTHSDWDPCNVIKRRRRSVSSSDKRSSFVIGSDGDCAGKSKISHCNGALQPGTAYRVKCFSCTNGGCSETYYSLPIVTAKEPEKSNVGVIAGAVAACVVFILFIVVLVQMRRRQAGCFAKAAEEGNTHRRSEPIPATELSHVERPTSVRYKPESVRLSEFPEHVERLKRDSLLIFSDMYKLLKENSPSHPCSVAESQICRPKNRYTNILPFDHSRVKILPLDDEEGSDYINANYIPGYTSRREYIATQGPMPATYDDFWRMVWEQNVEIIVMLTKLMEKGRNKCDKYWPNQGEPQFYGDLSLCIISESNLSDYTIRIMEIKLKGEKRRVKQFSFLKWPDMGCPEYPESLLEFVKSVRQHQSKTDRDRPIVVHCSAGVGRTGTFIAVDHLLQHIRDHDDLDIYNLVLEMRNNRCNMVQTEDQFVYIHECIREFITNDDDEDDYDEDDDHLYANSRQENVYENTGFAKQF